MRVFLSRALCVLRGENCFPVSERAGFGGHAELGPGAAPTLAAAGEGVQRGGVPLGAGAAGRFAGGEDFGWGGGEAGAGEAVRGVAEICEHFGTAGEDFGTVGPESLSESLTKEFGHEKTKTAGAMSGCPGS